MAKFKNDKGLTLIELLITIAVLAVVSAIALPVINNVVSSSNSNAAVQTQSDVTDFITKYNAAGETLFSSSVTTGTVLSGYVDTDGDNTIDSNELVDTLTIDAKFAASVSGTSDNVGGSYTNDGVTGATVTLAAAGSVAAPSTPTTIDMTGWTNNWHGLSTYDAASGAVYLVLVDDRWMAGKYYGYLTQQELTNAGWLTVGPTTLQADNSYAYTGAAGPYEVHIYKVDGNAQDGPVNILPF